MASLRQATCHTIMALSQSGCRLEVNFNDLMVLQHGVPLVVVPGRSEGGNASAAMLFSGWCLPQALVDTTSVQDKRRTGSMYYDAGALACDQADTRGREINKFTDPIVSAARFAFEGGRWVGLLADIYRSKQKQGSASSASSASGSSSAGSASSTSNDAGANLMEILKKTTAHTFSVDEAGETRRDIEANNALRELKLDENEPEDLKVLKALRKVDFRAIVRLAPRLTMEREIKTADQMCEFIITLRNCLRGTTRSARLEPDWGLDDLVMYIRQAAKGGTAIKHIRQGVAMVFYALGVQVDQFDVSIKAGLKGGAVPNAHRRGGIAAAYRMTDGRTRRWWITDIELLPQVELFPVDMLGAQGSKGGKASPGSSGRAPKLKAAATTGAGALLKWCGDGRYCENGKCQFAHPPASQKRDGQDQGPGSGKGQEHKKIKGGKGDVKDRAKGHCAEFLTATAKSGKGECKFENCRFTHADMTQAEAQAQCDAYLEAAKDLHPTSKGGLWSARFKY